MYQKSSLEVNFKAKKSKKSASAILVVDDDPLVLNSLESILKEEGYTNFTAKNGSEAISIMKEIPIAIIICDLNLPDINGIQVLKEAISLQPEAIRIIITGSGDLQKVVESINIGQISQFILKPWDNANLLQSISNSMEKYKLIHENQRLYDLISAQHQTLRKSHEGLREELKLGSRIYDSLLHGKIPAIQGLNISAISIPSRELDGDFFDFYHPVPHVLDIMIGDVMGKGIPAAVVGTAVKTQMIRFALPHQRSHMYDNVSFWHQDLLSPEEIVSLVQKEIARSLINLEYFVSLCYGRLDLQKQKLTYVDCGSPKPLQYVCMKKQVIECPGNDLPIGILEDEVYHSHEVSFRIGDLFLFYSDGVTEARSPEGEFFGIEKLKQLIEESADLEPFEINAIIKDAIKNFTKNEDFNDDLTLIAIKIGNLSIGESDYNQTVFASELSQIPAIRQFIQKTCVNLPGNSEKLSNQLELAVVEAFCNIVNHGYNKVKTGKITISVTYENERIVIDIADQGTSFNPNNIEEPDFSGGLDNRFGLYIIRNLVDQVQYIPKGSKTGQNHLKLFKNYLLQEDKMELAHELKNNILLVTLQGESLDAREAQQFKSKIQDLLREGNTQKLVLDLHNLQFIDSSGLGSFLSLLRTLNSTGGDLKLANMSKPIRSMFELVSMHRIFEIYNSNDDALSSFR